jgi:hypothetical protein
MEVFDDYRFQGPIDPGRNQKAQTRADFITPIWINLFYRLRRRLWHRTADRVFGPGLALLLIALTPLVFTCPTC